MTSGHLQPSRTVLQLVPLRLDLMLITSVASVSVDQQEERAQRDNVQAETEHDRASVSLHTPPQVRVITKDRDTEKEAKSGCILLPLN